MDNSTERSATESATGSGANEEVTTTSNEGNDLTTNATNSTANASTAGDSISNSNDSTSNSNSNSTSNSTSDSNNTTNNSTNSTTNNSTNNPTATAANPHSIDRFVILQFGNGPQQDVIIDYRDNIRNAIVLQRQRQLLSTWRRSTTDQLPQLPQPPQPSQLPQLPQLPPVRGLDYPAFDVSSEGVYRDNSVPAPPSASASQRIFEFLNPPTPANSGATPSPANEPATEPATPTTSNRNIILTVNYEYSSNVDQEDSRDRSASLVLNVPNVPQGEDESRLQLLIRFATIILFRTIATSLQNKKRGISDKAFAKLPVKDLAGLKEKECPICYDPFTDPKKRTRDEDEQLESATKLQKTLDGTAKGTANADSEPPHVAKSKIEYTHVPVEMSCHHVFGQACLHEWLKNNTSCPLCRSKVEGEDSDEAVQTTTMNLPNLATFLNDNGRNTLLDGEINRLPMLTVSNDSDPSTALEMLTNDLRNSLNNVPIIVTTAPTSIPSIVAATGAGLRFGAGGAAAGASGISLNPGSRARTTVLNRDNIVGRIINSLTNSISGGYASTLAMGGATSLASALRNLRQGSSVASEANSTSQTLEFIDRDPLFPIGVSSRRTATGVETVNMREQRPRGQGSRDQPNYADLLMQNSIVNDLLFGALRNAANAESLARRSDDTSAGSNSGSNSASNPTNSASNAAAGNNADNTPDLSEPNEPNDTNTE